MTDTPPDPNHAANPPPTRLKFPLFSDPEHNRAAIKNLFKKHFSPLGVSFACMALLLGILAQLRPPFGSEITMLFNHIFGVLLVICWICPPFILLAPFVAVICAYLAGWLISLAIPRSRASREAEIVLAIMITIGASYYLVMDYSGVFFQREQKRFWKDMAAHGDQRKVRITRVVMDEVKMRKGGRRERVVILAYNSPYDGEGTSISEEWLESAPSYKVGDEILVYYLTAQKFRYRHAGSGGRRSTQHNIALATYNSGDT